MPNQLVGEAEVTVGGVTYVLRPSFRALNEIDRLAGVGVMIIANNIAKSDFQTRQIVAVIYGGILGGLPKGQPAPMSFEEFGDALVQEGLMKFAIKASEFLSAAMVGPNSQKKTEANP